MDSKIDFVILWVDGNDKNWLKEKMQYCDYAGNATVNKYRDWDNLQYWFRGVEKYANWVNKIYFVTWGHLPKWLNADHPKLKIIRHEDYMPKEFLPTFNSCAIELNLHRIKELSETFVFFNDDTFILKKTKPSDFFKNGLPRDLYAEKIYKTYDYGDTFEHSLLNNVVIINKYFNKRKRLNKYKFKYINIKYGLFNLQTILLSYWNYYSGFENPHVSQNFLKSTFFKVWDKEKQACEVTSKSKFRDYNNVNQYLMKYWQLLEGKFIPRKYISKDIAITHDNTNLIKIIEEQKCKLLCANDPYPNIDFEKAKLEIKNAFEKILPNKSSFEK